LKSRFKYRAGIPGEAKDLKKSKPQNLEGRNPRGRPKKGKKRASKNDRVGETKVQQEKIGRPEKDKDVLRKRGRTGLLGGNLEGKG